MIKKIRNAADVATGLFAFLAPLWLLLAVIVGIPAVGGSVVALLCGKLVGWLAAITLFVGCAATVAWLTRPNR
jgi:hypothetical protein